MLALMHLNLLLCGYSPFKVDVWQLGHSFSDFEVWYCIFLLRHSLYLQAFRFSEYLSHYE